MRKKNKLDRLCIWTKKQMTAACWKKLSQAAVVFFFMLFLRWGLAFSSLFYGFPHENCLQTSKKLRSKLKNCKDNGKSP